MSYSFLRRICILLITVGFFGFSCQSGESFTMVNGETLSTIILPASEPECVRLAVADLVSDVEKISGKKLTVKETPPEGTVPALVIATCGLSDDLLDRHDPDHHKLKGKWEAYRIQSTNGNLVIAGSDERGTMFGIYRFIEEFLGVDPLYFWSDIAPEKKEKLAWKNIAVTQDSPSFRYRGWFINDEDLLTEWYESGGIRNIDYPYYGQVVNPAIMEKLVESMVRLQMNLIIPASFIDIRNPAEAALVKVAAKRGVFLSMHHIEPMGVSAFTFFNYWKEKTGEKPLFSYYSSRDKLEEVWRVYAEEWAQYPNVIWQIGLRGIADRPMWLADPGIPQSSAERGGLISEAMQTQRTMIKEVDTRPDPPVTTTLWMEGSALNKEGHLRIPDGTTVVFSDNCPGWKWQDDFHQTERNKAHTYGVYYHHQLWGAGPHLAQAISPGQTYSVFKQAVEKGSTEYAILNVSNIRQFLPGLASSASMLYKFGEYDPEQFLRHWIGQRFQDQTDEIRTLYHDYFAGFVLHDTQKVPMLLDGQTRSFARALLTSWEKQIQNPVEYQKAEERKAADANAGQPKDVLAINDAHPKPKNNGELLEKAQEQQARHSKTLEKAIGVVQSLDPGQADLLNTNLVGQLKIMIGLEEWLIGVLKAREAWNKGDKTAASALMASALEAFGRMKEGQQQHIQGDKWANWYRGDKKMNLAECKALTEKVASLVADDQN